MPRVKSSNIARYDYDENKGTLTVVFQGGGTYEYLKVPPIVYQGLLKASSKGNFLYYKIRNKFPYNKL